MTAPTGRHPRDRPVPAAELARRQGLALSLLNQREHTARLNDLVLLALQGATVEELLQIDKGVS